VGRITRIWLFAIALFWAFLCGGHSVRMPISGAPDGNGCGTRSLMPSEADANHTQPRQPPTQRQWLPKLLIGENRQVDSWLLLSSVLHAGFEVAIGF
jgi:hypothetical protein